MPVEHYPNKGFSIHPNPGDTTEDRCDNCGYVTRLTAHECSVSQRMAGKGDKDVNWFCEVCGNTPLHEPVISLYPEEWTDAIVMKSLGWIANKILDAIRENAKP